MNNGTRLLAAIMFTDIVGYTALMQKDEQNAKNLRDKHRKVLEDITLTYRGSVIQYYGDGTLSIFGSAVEAVNCAIEIQKELQKDPVVPVKIGLHIGDIVYDDEGVYGDGVNTASRIESLAIPGSVLVSDKLNDELHNHPDFNSVSLGKFELKNVKRPIEIFAIQSDNLIIPNSLQLAEAGLSKKSIAVLPFVNMSADIENEYFSDGITEEILNALAKVDGLQVTSRTSSFAFKGQNLDIREIGNKLGVSTVLEGSVRKAGNKVRITAQLITSADGYHIWSEVYDRSLEDIFEVQDEISKKIANTLQQKLSLDNKHQSMVKAPTHNIEAYNLLLKGKYHFNKFTPEDTLKALDYYKKALKIEPNLAKAYSAISGCYTLMGAIGWRKPVEVFPKAEKNIKKAMEIDDELAEAHLSEALLQLFYKFNMKASEKAFKKAIQLNPNSAEIRTYYAMYLGAENRLNEALAELETALSIDPLSINVWLSLARAHMQARDFEAALEFMDKVIEIDPSYRGGYEFKGWTYLFMGEYEKAIEQFNKYTSFISDPLKGVTGLGYTHAKMGNKDKAYEYLNKILERSKKEPETVVDIDIAILYEGVNDLDKAFEHLEKALSQKIGVIFLKTHPGWENIRKDPRFDLLINKYFRSENN